MNLYMIGKYQLEDGYVHSLEKPVAKMEITIHKELSELILQRRSVRKWTKKKVQPQDIEQVLELAK